MITTQGKALSAYTTLLMMSKKPMNSLSSYKLFKIKKALADIVEFQAEQERKLVANYGGSVNENGRVMFTDKTQEAEYGKAFKELQTLECEVNVEPIEMNPVEIPDMSISEIEILSPFIEWKE